METWKEIQGYEGLYEVSNYGQVRALERTVTNKHGMPQRYPAKLLKFDVSDSGTSKYYRATLCKDHTTKKYFVHRLVAEAFIPNVGGKPFINHIDNDGTNNQSSNLEWCTHSENMLHAQKQGRLFQAQSAGGKKGSAASHARALAKSEDIVGNIYNQWLVIHPLGKREGKNGKYYAQCRCLGCSREFSVQVDRLVRLEATACRTCGRIR